MLEVAGADATGPSLPVPARCPPQLTPAAGVVLQQRAEAEEKPSFQNCSGWEGGGGAALGLLVFRGCAGKGAAVSDFCKTPAREWSFLRLEQLEP